MDDLLHNSMVSSSNPIGEMEQKTEKGTKRGWGAPREKRKGGPEHEQRAACVSRVCTGCVFDYGTRADPLRAAAVVATTTLLTKKTCGKTITDVGGGATKAKEGE